MAPVSPAHASRACIGAGLIGVCLLLLFAISHAKAEPVVPPSRSRGFGSIQLSPPSYDGVLEKSMTPHTPLQFAARHFADLQQKLRRWADA